MTAKFWDLISTPSSCHCQCQIHASSIPFCQSCSKGYLPPLSADVICTRLPQGRSMTGKNGKIWLRNCGRERDTATTALAVFKVTATLWNEPWLRPPFRGQETRMRHSTIKIHTTMFLGKHWLKQSSIGSYAIWVVAPPNRVGLIH